MNDQARAEWLISTGWEEGFFDKGITLEEMGDLIVSGFKECAKPEECDSRIMSGESCKCIRQNFPSPEHFEFYKVVMKDFLKEKALALLARAVEGQQEKN